MAAAIDQSKKTVPIVPWWLVLIEGLALIAIGVMLLLNPGTTTTMLIRLLGIYWLIKGIITIIGIFFNHHLWGWKLFAGVLSILAGLLIFNVPIIAAVVTGFILVITMGILAIVIGAINLVEAFRGAGWGTGILGALAILVGLLLLLNPGVGTLTLPFMIGILAIGGGIIAVIGAFALRSVVNAYKKEMERAPVVPAVARTAGVPAPPAEGSVRVTMEGTSLVQPTAAGTVEMAATRSTLVETASGETAAVVEQRGAVVDAATGVVLAAAAQRVEAVETAEGVAVTETETAAALVEGESGPVVAAVQDSSTVVATAAGETFAAAEEQSVVMDAATGAVLAAEVKQASLADTAEGTSVEVSDAAGVLVETETGPAILAAEESASIFATPEGEVSTAAEKSAVLVDAASGEVLAAASTLAGPPAELPEEVEIPDFVDIPEEQARFLKQDIEYVEGIGPAYGAKLKAIGINSPLDLLRKGATRKGRELIVEACGISAKLILKWVNHADLFRLKGVGSEYADLLEAAGVDTVVELAQRNAHNLHTRLVEVNEEKKLVRLVPAQTQVEGWIEQAKVLGRVVSY